MLTGGSAKMEGAIELAEEVFHVPVRLGLPQHIRGLSDVVRNPIYSTGAGLLLYARDNALAGNRGRSITGNARTMARAHEELVSGAPLTRVMPRWKSLMSKIEADSTSIN